MYHTLSLEYLAWGITLAHQFFYSLSSIIQGNLNEDDSFQLADPSTSQTKSDHLRALLLVRTAAQSAYLKLEKQKELMAEVMSSSQSGTAVAALYKSNPSTATCIPEGHQLISIDGVQHVKNTTTGYVSKFPYGYSGCFCCGDTLTGKGCWPKEKCPAFNTVSKEDFFNEFNYHMVKKPLYGRCSPTPSHEVTSSQMNDPPAERQPEVTQNQMYNPLAEHQHEVIPNQVNDPLAERQPEVIPNNPLADHQSELA
ncbi:predicted protein [Chaetoceros tenuissimus]|uniref:Uncharacterized protein n=1 Tax=Chaetoceros tenuissimus TaxID=426638 RepID=A0AAD3CT72_9STRA|nr:predicted protein [Chaetoceros tenuissimus]